MNDNSPGDQNVERLLAEAYDPEPIDPEFVNRTHAHLTAVVAERRRPIGRRQSYWTVWAAAAGIAGLIVVPMSAWRANPERPVPRIAKVNPLPEPKPAPWSDQVTPLARQTLPELERLEVGQTLTTAAREKKRVKLIDDSILAINENTSVKLESDRKVTLCKGQVYVEVSPRTTETDGNRFVVQSGKKTITALGTRFGVSSATECCSLAVTQGKVKVNDRDEPVSAGNALEADKVTPAPRATHLLDWARDLLSGEQLVPVSTFAGGALVAKADDGQETRLSLREYKTDVHIEDGFARTTIDQTYFNESFGRLEGTFHFPLPPDASLSRLAMYVDGTRMEGGMVERDYGRQVFEEIVRKQQDPALLEWVDGSTFKMRVFPLEGRQEKRIILSYTQKLPQLYGKTTYRFPAGHSLGEVAHWTFAARVKDGVPMTWASPSHKLKATNDKNDLLLSGGAWNAKLDRDVVLELTDAKKGTGIIFSSTEHDGARYLGLRYRPELGGEAAKRQKRDWVILFESSAERNPLLARTQIDIVRTVLENSEHDDTFAVVTANNTAKVLSEPRTAEPDNINKVIAQLDDTHLIGALDLGAALQAATPLLESSKNPHLLHVGSALPKLGERSTEKLVEKLPANTHYIGVGVGKRWNRAFMKSAAERTGGYVTQINPDEPVTWRAFDLLATLNTPRLLGIHVVDPDEKLQFLTYDSMLAQGEELCAIARTESKDAWPRSVIVTGKLDGKDFHKELPLGEVTQFAGYLPRTWGRLEIDRLVADGAAKNKDRIVDLSKKLYVMSPFTSLLVLETPEMYERYKVDRGRKDHWAAYECPEKIPVYYEPVEGPPVAWKSTEAKPVTTTPTKLTKEQVLETVVVRLSDTQARLERIKAINELAKHARYEVVSGRQTRGLAARRLYETLPDPLDTFAFSTDGARIASNGSNGTVRLWDMETSGLGMQMPSSSSGVVPYFAQPNLLGTYDRSRMWMADGSVRVLDTRTHLAEDLPYQEILGESRGWAATNFYPLNGRWDENDLGKRRRAPLSAVEFEAFQQLGDLDAGIVPRIALDYDGERIQDGFMSPIRFGFSGEHGIPQSGAADDFYDRLAESDKKSHRRSGRLSFGFERERQDRIRAEIARGTFGMRAKDLEHQVRSLARAPTDLIAGSVLHFSLDDQLGYFPSTSSLVVKTPSLLHTRPTRASLGIDRQLAGINPRQLGADVFRDLLIYAPGLNTMPADIYAVLEAEGDAGQDSNPSNERKSKIADRARQLIERARSAGWFTITLPADGDAPALTLTCDGQGRFRCERVLPWGLREIIVCDGKTLLHLYPELGLGARRTVSRFHRSEFARLVPWIVLPVEDLARGADLESPDERTVLVVPHQGSHNLRLTFTADGTVAQRAIVKKTSTQPSMVALAIVQAWGALVDQKRFDTEKPEGKTVWKQELATEGRIRLIVDEKELNQLGAIRKPAETFKLTTEGENLVILPLPYRTVAELKRTSHEIEGRHPARLTDEAAMTYLAALVGSRSSELANFLDVRFFRRGDTRPGLYTLLAGTGQMVEPGAATHMHYPRLTSYVQQLGPDQRAGVTAVRLLEERDLLGRLSALQRIDTMARAADVPQPSVEKVLFPELRTCRLPNVLEALIAAFSDTQMDNRPGRRAFRLRVLDELATATSDLPDVNYVARYEAARCVLSDGRAQEAKQRFVSLHAETIAAGHWPSIDGTFLSAFGKDADRDDWARVTAEDLLCRDMPAGVFVLAAESRSLGYPQTADVLIDQALKASLEADVLRAVRLAAINQFCQANQLVRAENVLRDLLTDPGDQCKASIWRMAARVALLRNDRKDAVARLETALAIAWEKRDSRNTLIVCQDYETLLDLFRQEIADQRTLADATARVLRIIERWRLLDPTAPAAERAAHVLVALGERDLAWEYLTTWHFRETAAANEWQNAAAWLQQAGAFDLATRATRIAEGK